MQDPLRIIRDKLKSEESLRLKLYNAVRENLVFKIMFYSQNVVNEYRDLIHSQQKAFSNMCASGFQPKTIVLELKQTESNLPVFVNVDMEQAVINLLPSVAYYKFSNYPDISGLQAYDEGRVDGNEFFSFCVSIGLAVQPETGTSEESKDGEDAENAFGAAKGAKKASKKPAITQKQNTTTGVTFPVAGKYELVTTNSATEQYFKMDITLNEEGTLKIPPCSEWKMPRTRPVFDDNDSETLNEARRMYVDSLKTSNAQWLMCVSAIERLHEIPDLDSLSSPEERNQAIESVVKSVTDALKYFIERVAGDARLDIKRNVAGIINTYLTAPTYYQDKYLNFALVGGAGTGKTTVANALGKLLGTLGILVREKMTTHSRSTLVGSYVGQTAEKTRGQLVDNLEGIMFVDEAYSIAQSAGGGGGDKFDMYGIESINEFINFMDKTKGRISIITAGYEAEMKEFWFGPNEGMERRMPFVWKLNNYSAYDLFKISINFYRSEMNRTPLLFPHTDSNGTRARILTGSLLDIIEDSTLLFELFTRSCDQVQLTRDPNVKAMRLRNQAGDVENVVRALTSAFIESLRDNNHGSLVGQLLSNDFVTAVFNERFVVPLGERQGKKYEMFEKYVLPPSGSFLEGDGRIDQAALVELEDALNDTMSRSKSSLPLREMRSSSSVSVVTFSAFTPSADVISRSNSRKSQAGARATPSSSSPASAGSGSSPSPTRTKRPEKIRMEAPAPQPAARNPRATASAAAADVPEQQPLDAREKALDKLINETKRITPQTARNKIDNELISFGISLTGENMFLKGDGTGGDYFPVLFGSTRRSFPGLWIIKGSKDQLITNARTHTYPYKPVITFEDFDAALGLARRNSEQGKNALRALAQSLYVFYLNWSTFTPERLHTGVEQLIIYINTTMTVSRRLVTDITLQKLMDAVVEGEASAPAFSSAVCYFLTTMITQGQACAQALEIVENRTVFQNAIARDYAHFTPTFNMDRFVDFCIQFLRSVAPQASFGRARKAQIHRNVRHAIETLKQNPSPQQRLKVIQMIHHQSHFDKHGLTISM